MVHSIPSVFVDDSLPMFSVSCSFVSNSFSKSLTTVYFDNIKLSVFFRFHGCLVSVSCGVRIILHKTSKTWHVNCVTIALIKDSKKVEFGQDWVRRVPMSSHPAFSQVSKGALHGLAQHVVCSFFAVYQSSEVTICLVH